MNRVTLVGNITRDVELRKTQSGMSVMNLSVAVNNRRKNQQTGEWEDEPCFVDCVMFGTRAEAVSNFLHKGSKIGVDGKLRFSQWEAKDGSGKRSKLEVLIDDLELLTPKGQNGGSGYQNGSQGGYQQQGGGYNPNGYGAPQNASQQPQQQVQQQMPMNAADDIYQDDTPF